MADTTRRAFIGTAALTAASYQRILGANDRIGVGFIGFGLIGKQHIADFKKFIAEQGGSFIEAVVRELPPGSYRNFEADLYFFQAPQS